MKGSEEITKPEGGECAGVTFTVVKVGSLSNDFANKSASGLTHQSLYPVRICESWQAT